MSINQLQKIFNYEGANVRTVIVDGELWFVAKDVCDVFGESNRNRAMQVLDKDEKGYTQITTSGGVQRLATVNEADLYSLLFAMQPTKARGVNDKYVFERETRLENFKRWVTHEVLPSIRKHGMYITPEAAQVAIDDVEAFLSRALLIAKDKLDTTKKLSD